MDKNGYYASLVKSQIGTQDNHKEIEKIKDIKKNLTKKLTMKYTKIIQHEEIKKEKNIISDKQIEVKKARRLINAEIATIQNGK